MAQSAEEIKAAEEAKAVEEAEAAKLAAEGGDKSKEELQKELDTLKTQVATLGDVKSQLATLQESLTGEEYLKKVAAAKGKKPDEPPPVSDTDLDLLERKDFAKFIIAEIDKTNAPKIADINERIHVIGLYLAVEECRRAHPGDFDELTPAMKKISEKKPELLPEDVYKIAKDDAREEKKKAEAKAAAKKAASERAGGPEGDKEKVYTPDEAGAEALEDVKRAVAKAEKEGT